MGMGAEREKEGRGSAGASIDPEGAAFGLKAGEALQGGVEVGATGEAIQELGRAIADSIISDIKEELNGLSSTIDLSTNTKPEEPERPDPE